MRGLEPPRGCPHGDLNAARLPIPPHPLAVARIADGGGRLGSASDDPEVDRPRPVPGGIRRRQDERVTARPQAVVALQAALEGQLALSGAGVLEAERSHHLALVATADSAEGEPQALLLS